MLRPNSVFLNAQFYKNSQRYFMASHFSKVHVDIILSGNISLFGTQAVFAPAGYNEDWLKGFDTSWQNHPLTFCENQWKDRQQKRKVLDLPLRRKTGHIKKICVFSIDDILSKYTFV